MCAAGLDCRKKVPGNRRSEALHFLKEMLDLQKKWAYNSANKKLRRVRPRVFYLIKPLQTGR